MVATYSSWSSARMLLMGALVLVGFGAAGFFFLRKHDSNRGQVRDILEQKYGVAEAERRLVDLEASVSKKTALGQEAFWERTLRDLKVPPEMRREIDRRQQEELRIESREAFRSRTAGYQVTTLRPKALLTLPLREAPTIMRLPVSEVGDPPLRFAARYSDGLVATFDYATAVLQPGASPDSRDYDLIAKEGLARLPLSVHFDFTLTEVRSYADAVRRLGFDRKGEIVKSQDRPRIVSLPGLPSKYRDIQVIDGYAGVSIHIYRKSHTTPKPITSPSQATEARAFGVRRSTP